MIMGLAEPGDTIEKTVEDWLKEVNYVDDPTYCPTGFALEFVNFIKMVNGGEGEENKTPVLHFKMLDQITHGDSRILNMIHRGAAKTTVMGEYLFLYLGVYGEIPGFGSVELALYVSDSVENGVKNMRKNLEFRWENSAFLQRMIPEARFTDIRWEFTNIKGKKVVIKGYGAKTGVRGAKEMGKRPRLAVLDDLVSDEDARSQTVISAIEDTVYKAVDYALHPSRNMMIWSGTPFNAGDPLYKAVNGGAWSVNVYPVCERFPCTREEFRGSWPDRFTYDYVLDKYTKALKGGKIATFNQELMLRIMSDEDRLIQDSEIRWYDSKNIKENPSRYNFYITTDFATSDKQSADFSVISVWAVNNNKDWFWVDGICERQDMGKNVDDLFRLASEYKPQAVGIEVTGQQAGFVPWILQLQSDRNQFFTLASKDNSNAPGIRPNTNKLQRFNLVVPWFKAGKMYFPLDKKTSKPVAEAMDELTLASLAGFKSRHDDFVDTISMLASLKVWYPSEEVTMQRQEGSAIWEDKTDNGWGNSRMGSYTV